MIKGEYCKADILIDDIITGRVNKGDILQRMLTGPFTIMHAAANNASSDTFVPR